MRGEAQGGCVPVHPGAHPEGFLEGVDLGSDVAERCVCLLPQNPTGRQCRQNGRHPGGGAAAP